MQLLIQLRKELTKMTLEDLKEAVEAEEDRAKRELQELKKKGKTIPEQDGEWIANMWEMSNKPLYYALEKIKMTMRYAKAIQTIWSVERELAKIKYSHIDPAVMCDYVNEEVTTVNLHETPSREEMTLPVQIPDTRTEAQKAWDGLLEMKEELERNRLENRLKV